MSKLLLTILTLFNLSLSKIIHCSSDPCEIDANSSLTVICDKTIQTLIVNCISKISCKFQQRFGQGLIVYSSANNSYINCFGEDSCEQTILNFGITPPAELGTFHSGSFTGPRGRATVSCSKKQSCKGMEITTDGPMKYGLTIDTPVKQGDQIVEKEIGAFSDTTIHCNSECVLNCRNSLTLDSCKNSKCFEGLNGLCVCKGVTCPANLKDPTLAPTPPPVRTGPSPKPTPEPTDLRRLLICGEENCQLQPENNFDVECGLEFRECNVNCLLENQCQNGVIVTANSNVVNIHCGGKNSCDKLEVRTVGSSIVNLVCDDAIACGSAIVIVTYDYTTVNIDINGREGFKSGRLYCNGICNLNCNAADSCKTVKYECTNQEQNCKCVGDCPKDKGMTMDMFGDMTCQGQETNCVIVGDGQMRVVATNNVDKLTVICDNTPKQCKKIGNGLRIFSGAKETIVRCGNADGCEEVKANIGPLQKNRLPKGFTESDFESRLGIGERQSLVMDCGNTGSCKKSEVYVSIGVQATVMGDGDKAMENSKLSCHECSDFGLSCLDFSGCMNTKFDCDINGVCWCESVYVDIGNKTVTTRTPRHTCPNVIVKRISNVNAINNNDYNNVNNVKRITKMESSLKIILPVVIVFAVFAACLAIMWYAHKKKYNKINGMNEMSILKNERIYGTYEVEMH